LQLNPRLDVLLGPVEKLFAVLNELIPSNYWETHYVLGKPSKPVNKKLGKQFVHNLLINAVAPIRWTYYHTILNKPLETDVAEMLSALPAEKNRFTRIFESAGIKPRNALETQAVLHLFRNYCSEKRCMQCQIGVKILRSS